MAGLYDFLSLLGLRPAPVTPDQELWVTIEMPVTLHVCENQDAGEYRGE